MQVTLAQGHTGSRSATYSAYVRVLTWLFTLTSSIRVLTYLPAIAAIVASGDSSQHSLWTWGAWFASNLTMAIWLWEHNGQRCNRAVAVNLGNAAMCAATVVVVVVYRF